MCSQYRSTLDRPYESSAWIASPSGRTLNYSRLPGRMSGGLWRTGLVLRRVQQILGAPHPIPFDWLCWWVLREEVKNYFTTCYHVRAAKWSTIGIELVIHIIVLLSGGTRFIIVGQVHCHASKLGQVFFSQCHKFSIFKINLIDLCI